MANQKSRKAKKAREGRANAQIKNAAVPGADRADSPTDVAALNAAAGPLYFFDPQAFGGFMAPESEANGGIAVGEQQMTAIWPDRSNRPPLGGKYCGHFFSAEHLLLTVFDGPASNMQGRFMMSKDRQHLLKRYRKFEVGEEDDPEELNVTSVDGRGNPPFALLKYPDMRDPLSVDFTVECTFLHSKDRQQMIKQLLATKGRELIYASPTDDSMGIGFSPADAKRQAIKERGQNLWGKALMNLRDKEDSEGKTLEQVLEDIKKADEEKIQQRVQKSEMSPIEREFCT